MSKINPEKTLVGWREWVSLPDLGIAHIKAKVDTGARTSALHAFDVAAQQHDGKDFVHFKIHPLQRNNDMVVECRAEIIEQREVTDSGGHKELRFVINTSIVLGSRTFISEMTLTNRDTMIFRMLLGRTTLKPDFIVDPARSYLTAPDRK